MIPFSENGIISSNMPDEIAGIHIMFYIPAGNGPAAGNGNSYNGFGYFMEMPGRR